MSEEEADCFEEDERRRNRGIIAHDEVINWSQHFTARAEQFFC